MAQANLEAARAKATSPVTISLNGHKIVSKIRVTHGGHASGRTVRNRAGSISRIIKADKKQTKKVIETMLKGSVKNVGSTVEESLIPRAIF